MEGFWLFPLFGHMERSALPAGLLVELCQVSQDRKQNLPGWLEEIRGRITQLFTADDALKIELSNTHFNDVQQAGWINQQYAGHDIQYVLFA